LNELVIFASGSGSNFRSIIDHITNGHLDAKILGLITNTAEIGAIDIAKQHGIPYRVFASAQFESTEAYELALLDQCVQWNPKLIICAGYLRKIPTILIQAYPNRILNIHPSLLPKFGGQGFYGIHVHKSVLESNETHTGCTIHIVSAEYDKGPILAQERLLVDPSESAEHLAKRVLKLEHQLYPRTIASYLYQLNHPTA
jgi:phosphoribosylglycinamide formyltransferase 1